MPNKLFAISNYSRNVESLRTVLYILDIFDDPAKIKYFVYFNQIRANYRVNSDQWIYLLVHSTVVVVYRYKISTIKLPNLK